MWWSLLFVVIRSRQCLYALFSVEGVSQTSNECRRILSTAEHRGLIQHVVLVLLIGDLNTEGQSPRERERERVYALGLMELFMEYGSGLNVVKNVWT
jgi:hypothetical protein